MTSRTRANRLTQWAWRATARAAAAIIVTVPLALLGVACGGSPASSSSPSPVAFSRCMRTHGVPNFPDPDSSGVLPKVTPEQLGVSSSQFDSAEAACAYLLQPTQAQAQLEMSDLRNFAACMRSHGVPNWPDPTTDSTGPVFDIPGIDPMSQKVSDAADACLRLIHRPTNGHPPTVELCDGIGENGECHGYGNPNG